MAAVAPVTDARLEAYADLAIRVGANVQPGQKVLIHAGSGGVGAGGGRGGLEDHAR